MSENQQRVLSDTQGALTRDRIMEAAMRDTHLLKSARWRQQAAHIIIFVSIYDDNDLRIEYAYRFSEELGKWMELGNSGMFRPEMLRPMGLPADVSVIAFGLGLERPTMILYGIDNIRDLFGHKVRLCAKDIYSAICYTVALCNVSDSGSEKHVPEVMRQCQQKLGLPLGIPLQDGKGLLMRFRVWLQESDPGHDCDIKRSRWGTPGSAAVGR